jgi:hypothetical protein
VKKTFHLFDVMKRMIDTDDKGIELAPLANISNLRAVKAGTQVTIGVSGNRVGPIYNGDYIGGLVLVKRARFNEVLAEMEREASE